MTRSALFAPQITRAANGSPFPEKRNSSNLKKDKEVVEQILEDGIHILIEMQGHSAANRIPVFMYKPAPIQISWLSQGTLGVPEIDYLIGSPHITPLNEENHFIEELNFEEK